MSLGTIEVVFGQTGALELVGDTFPVVAGSGGGVTAYEHTQSAAATLWTINHNLGRKPIIALFSVGGVEIVADIVHASLNQAQVNFNVATAGTARCI